MPYSRWGGSVPLSPQRYFSLGPIPRAIGGTVATARSSQSNGRRCRGPGLVRRNPGHPSPRAVHADPAAHRPAGPAGLHMASSPKLSFGVKPESPKALAGRSGGASLRRHPKGAAVAEHHSGHEGPSCWRRCDARQKPTATGPSAKTWRRPTSARRTGESGALHPDGRGFFRTLRGSSNTASPRDIILDPTRSR